MGSWNATCQISQLPILCGDKVRVIFLQKNSFSMDPPNELSLKGMNDHAKERCYSTDWWSPVTIPIRARYADYGQVDKIRKGHALDIFWEQLRKNLVPVPKGENEYHDIESHVGMDWDTMWSVAHEGRLRVRSVGVVPLVPVLVREDVWQMLAKERFEDFRVLSLDTVMDSFKEARKSIDAVVTDFDDPRSQLRLLFNLELEWIFQMGSFKNYRLTDAFIYLTQKKVPMTTKVWTDLAELVHIDSLMNRPLRKFWSPQSGAGSQDISFEFVGKFHRRLAEIAESAWEKYEEQYPSDEEDCEEEPVTP
jgi:hypothetical protein